MQMDFPDRSLGTLQSLLLEQYSSAYLLLSSQLLIIRIERLNYCTFQQGFNFIFVLPTANAHESEGHFKHRIQFNYTHRHFYP